MSIPQSLLRDEIPRDEGNAADGRFPTASKLFCKRGGSRLLRNTLTLTTRFGKIQEWFLEVWSGYFVYLLMEGGRGDIKSITIPKRVLNISHRARWDHWVLTWIAECAIQVNKLNASYKTQGRSKIHIMSLPTLVILDATNMLARMFMKAIVEDR